MSKKLQQGWKECKLEDIVVDVKNAIADGPFGSSLKVSDYVDDGIPVLQGKNITSNVFKFRDIRFITEEKAQTIIRSKVVVGDILIVKIGSIGYSAELTELDNYPYGIIPANLCKATIDESKANKKYILYCLRSDNVINYLNRNATKTAQPALSLKTIKSIPIMLPPLKEQERMVSILERAESAKQKRKETLTILDELVKSRFIEMFGDPVKNTKCWNMELLSKIGTLGRGVSKHRPRNAPELLGGDYPLIQTGDVANSGLYIKEYNNTYSELGLKQSKLWTKGTLCITIAANIAKTGILGFDACFPDSIVGFIAGDKTNNIFMNYWFASFQKLLEEQAPESAQKNINLKILSELSVIMPPIELQNKFAEFVKQVDKLKFEMEKSLEELENNFNALMQRAFKGEL